MRRLFGWMPGIASAMAQGPWGGKGDGPEGNDGPGKNGSGGGSDGPRNPWTQPGKPAGGKSPSAIEELLREESRYGGVAEA